jgi:hypothetical protein
MLRTFGIQTLTGSAQPLFTDVTTAIVPQVIGDNFIKVKVANLAIYQQGDRITLAPGTATPCTLLVDSTDAANKYLLCQVEGGNNLRQAYPSGTVITLSLAAMEVIVQADNANAGVIYVGTDNTVTATGGGNVVYEVTPTDPFRMTNSGSNNTVRTSDGWMAGTAGLKVVCTAVVL